MKRRAKFHFDNLYSEMNRKIGPYVIYQVGDLCCEPSYQVWPHKQKVYEISYIVSGKGTFIINNEQHEAEGGMLFLNRIGDVHEITSSKQDPLRFFYLGFDFLEDLCTYFS